MTDPLAKHTSTTDARILRRRVERDFIELIADLRILAVEQSTKEAGEKLAGCAAGVENIRKVVGRVIEGGWE